MYLFESALSEQVTFYPGQGLVGVVVSLLDQSQLLPLTLIQPRFYAVSFLQPLKSQNQQFRVVLVGQRREGNWREAARLEPVHGGRVNGHGLLRRDVGTVLEVVVLPLLLGLQVETSQPTQILLAHRLVHRGSATYSLAIVVRRVCPPVGLHLHVSQNHVLNGNRQPRDLPRNVRLPASPCLAQVLQNRSCLVLLYSLGHHVDNVVHHGGAQLQVKVRLDSLLGDRLSDAL